MIIICFILNKKKGHKDMTFLKYFVDMNY